MPIHDTKQKELSMNRSLTLSNGNSILHPNKNSLILGKPGSGKTTFFSSVLSELIKTNTPFIVHDFKGELFKKFYNPDAHRFYCSVENNFPFESLTTWINSSDLVRGIFVLGGYEGKQSDTAISTAYIDNAIKTLLMSPDSDFNNIHFLLDELCFLSLNSMINLLTQSRSKGASVWLSFQDVNQIRQFSNDANNIADLCYNYFSFSLSDEETAIFMQNRIPNTTINDLFALTALKYYAKCGNNSVSSNYSLTL